MIHIEQVADGVKRIEESQEKMLDKLESIHIETVKTNGRVTALEKTAKIMWGLWGIAFVILLVLVSKGIISPSDLPKP